MWLSLQKRKEERRLIASCSFGGWLTDPYFYDDQDQLVEERENEGDKML